MLRSQVRGKERLAVEQGGERNGQFWEEVKEGCECGRCSQTTSSYVCAFLNLSREFIGRGNASSLRDHPLDYPLNRGKGIAQRHIVAMNTPLQEHKISNSNMVEALVSGSPRGLEGGSKGEARWLVALGMHLQVAR
jgi:hypothetical protein